MARIAFRLLLRGFCVVLLASKLLFGSDLPDSLDRPAIAVAHPTSAVLLSITKAGERIVAAGERGIIIFSDDNGQHWMQADVPSSDTLTVVRFVSPKVGWAAGHSGLVLHTTDGGQTWIRQLDGVTAAKLTLDAVKARFSGKKDSNAETQLANAERNVNDGPDKPFLDLLFENEQVGLVVGAYGIILHTEDGGKTWASWADRVDNPEARHLYGIARLGNTYYLAGEQGLFLQSTDGGKEFKRVQTPYKGTYFSVVTSPTKEVILAGMKGSAFRYNGETFSPVGNPSPVNLTAMIWLADGRLVFCNQAGQLLTSTDNGKSMQPLPVPPLPPIADLVELKNGTLLTVGIAGLIPVSLIAPTQPNSQGGVQ